MASNFKFFSYPTRDSLHLKLFGDFDGSSAKELINALVDYGTDFFQIFIDTNNLRTIYTFGKNVLQKNFGDLEKLSSLIFIGENERHLAQN